jgi:DMSO/TMAO reductase YedYZ molybdopterin-dependent catalytic subunit
MVSRRAPIVGRYTAEEVALAARNRGMPLEALRYDVTPPGLHYLLVHFDIPDADESHWKLEVGGLVSRPFALSLGDLKALPEKTLRVTMECAGNGRGQLSPRYPSVPWLEEGVSTADWTGVALSELLNRAGLRENATELVFHGADRGIDAGVEHHFARSLSRTQALGGDALVAYAMNGAPLPPQHGAPLRLVVPRWYGMASVKWLRSIEARDAPFDGLQQARSYHFRRSAGEKGEPCTLMRVNSLMAPPGIPDFYTRKRVVDAGEVAIVGRTWSGAAPIARVEFGVDGKWSDAVLGSYQSHCWQKWETTWAATPGEHELACRATDNAGNSQPLEPPWDLSGFGNNGVQRIQVTVRP